MKLLLPALAALACCAALGADQPRYAPTWESIDARPIPAWFDEAKFGIFIHWGVYSVPAWAPKGQYAEWYWNHMQAKDGPTWKFHAATYGERFRYQDFAPLFKAELFDPDRWAQLFAASGARYVVLTSKHHDGYCLWPSAESWNWNSVDTGPHRDLVGDLASAVRAKGVRFGLYYSMYEWFNPIYQADPKRYVDQHTLPQLKDLVTRYKPATIFSDGQWDHPSELWRSTEFLAWLYNEGPNRDEVVVDDRWGSDTVGKHGGYYTTEYGNVADAKLAIPRKWEECRGIGASFGYNRNEDADDYKSADDLIRVLVEIVAKGGNLLLDIGPAGDGTVPPIMQDRLLAIGNWLATNGEAIYAAKPWRALSDGKAVRYTAKPDAVYAILLHPPSRELTLSEPKPARDTKVTLLGHPTPLKWRSKDGKMVIEMPDEALAQPVPVVKLVGVR